jgi:hypothetical protein
MGAAFENRREGRVALLSRRAEVERRAAIVVAGCEVETVEDLGITMA